MAVLFIMIPACGKKDGGRTAVAFPDSLIDNELIATVNDIPVNGGDLRLFAAIFMQQNRQMLPDSTFNKMLLDKMIDRVLLWREAVDNGVVMDDSTSAGIIARFIQAMGGESAIDNFLVKGNFTRDGLMDNLKQDLIINKFIEDRFSREINVDEKRAREFYDQNQAQFLMPDSVRARHILVRVLPDDTPEVKQKKRESIEGIMARAKNGENFTELANLFSEDPTSSKKGGDLGLFPRKAMVAPFDSAAFSMKTGEISGVIKTRFGFHILKVEEKKHGVKLAFDDVKNDLMSKMWETEMVGKLQEHLQEIRKTAVIARNY